MDPLSLVLLSLDQSLSLDPWSIYVGSVVFESVVVGFVVTGSYSIDVGYVVVGSVGYRSIVFGFVEDGSKTLLTDLQMAFSQKDLRQTLFVQLKCKLD